MRIAFIFLIITITAFSIPARAGDDQVAFPLSNSECVAVGDITIGPDGRWAHCKVIKSGWVATIDLLDLYQTQYCLGKKADVCDQRAQLLFANRAYTPDAQLLLQRIDPGNTEYDAPLIVDTEQGAVMMQATHASGAPDVRRYYLWQTNLWLPIDDKAWLRDLAQYLPEGTVKRVSASWPDIETMSVQAMLYQEDDADCCPNGGVADISLMLSEGQFLVKNVEVRTSVE